jgi:Ca2+-binding RTX toxin-like protein
MDYSSIASLDAPTRLVGFDAASGVVSLYSLNGSGFSLDQTVAQGFVGYALAAGDVDGDGRDDLVLWDTTRISVLFNDGAGNFSDMDLYQDGAANLVDVSTGDFDGDGKAELLVAAATSGGPQVWNAGRTGYTASSAWSPSGSGTAGWITGDFNGDGQSDGFTYRHGFSGADMWLSDGSALNYAGIWTPAAPVGKNWLTGDFDGDGLTDIVGASGRFLRSTGTGFVDAGRVADGSSTIVAVADFDGDGRADLVIRGADGQLTRLGQPLSDAAPPMILADQSHGQPAVALLGDEIAVSVTPSGTDMSYRFSLVTQNGNSIMGVWSDLPEARFELDATGVIGVMVEIRNDLTGELTSRQYATDPITVRDPAVVADLLDLSRFAIAEYGGEISLAASQLDWRASIASFEGLFDYAASVVASAGGGSSSEFSVGMAKATGFLQFVSGLWGLGEFDGSPGGVMANSVIGVTLPLNASVDTYLDSPVGLCTDYAAILALFLTKAGYENRVISGAGHIFNEVQIDGQWWIFDSMVGMALEGTLDEVLDTANPVRVMLFENAQSDPSSPVFRPSNTDSLYLLNWYHNSVSPDNYRYNAIDFLFFLPYGEIFEPALDLSKWAPAAPAAMGSHGDPEGMALGDFVAIVSRKRLEVVLVATDVSALASEANWRQGISSFASFAARVDDLLATHFGVARASEIGIEDRARFYAQFVSGLWRVEATSSTAATWADLLANESAGAGDFFAALTGLLINAGLSPVIRSTGNGLVAEVQIGGQIFAFDPVAAMNFVGGWNVAADTSQPANIEAYQSVNLQGGQSFYSSYAAGLRYELLAMLAGELIAPSQAFDGLAYLAGSAFGGGFGVIETLQGNGPPRILAISPDRAIDGFMGWGSVAFDVIVSKADLTLTVGDFTIAGMDGVITSLVAIDPLRWRLIVTAANGAAFASAPWLTASATGQIGAFQFFEADADGTAWTPTLALASYQGGSGVDTVDFSGVWQSPVGVDVDLTTGQGKGGFAQGDAFSGIEILIGTDHDDRLRGSAGDNILAGGAGADILIGEAGNDQLLGGAGADRLAGGAGADRLDGGADEDTADYSDDDGAVWIDLAAGSGKWNSAAGDVLIDIENVTGTRFGDRLYGTPGNNKLEGGDGDDLLAGGMGADRLHGGAGRDTADYSGDFGGINVNLATGAGYYNAAHGDVLTGIENIVGTSFGDALYGSADANQLYGGEGNDLIYGDDGADLLVGGAGADTLDGGAGEDSADYTGNFGAVWIDLATGVGKWNWAHGDILTGIENVVGTSYGDRLVGSSGSNKLFGDGGVDTLSGGAGDDLLSGGADADILDGGDGEDTADYRNDFGAVWVDLNTGVGKWNWAHGDTLTGIENVFGSDLGDRLYGSADANKLYGGDGSDLLSGGAGTDLLDGGAGDDTADYTGNYGAVWVDLSSGVGKWNWAEGDTLTGVENIVGTSYGDRLYGSAEANRLYGGDGDDLLSGGDGTDLLVGGAGADTLDGGDQEDNVDYSGSVGAVWIDLATGIGKWNWAQGDVLTNVENVIGTSYGDRLEGSGGANKLYGGNGDDLILGGEGDDLIDGGPGLDVALYAGFKDDYEIRIEAGQIIVIDRRPDVRGDEGQDILRGIETIRFRDGTEISLAAPVILDLDGNGIWTRSVADGVAAFDVDGDGLVDRSSWIGTGDAFLFLDRDRDGTVTGGGEISFINDVPAAGSDLEGLAFYDSNRDGWLDTSDDRFAEFRLWIDGNGDGISQAGETAALPDLGVARISLTAEHQSGVTAIDNVVIVGIGTFVRSDGTLGQLADAMLTYRRGTGNAVTPEPDAATQASGSQRHFEVSEPLLSSSGRPVVQTPPARHGDAASSDAAILRMVHDVARFVPYFAQMDPMGSADFSRPSQGLNHFRSEICL